MKKKICTAIMIICCVCMLMTTAMAKYDITFEPSLSEDGQTIKTMASRFLFYIQWAGYIVGFGMLLFIGIKYTMASADAKANLKSSLVKYIIGAVLVVGASVITTAILTMGGTYGG